MRAVEFISVQDLWFRVGFTVFFGFWRFIIRFFGFRPA